MGLLLEKLLKLDVPLRLFSTIYYYDGRNDRDDQMLRDFSKRLIYLQYKQLKMNLIGKIITIHANALLKQPLKILKDGFYGVNSSSTLIKLI